MKWTEIDFRIVGPQIDTLLTAFANLIEREWPAKWKELDHAQLLVLGSVKLSATTYQVTKFLCKERAKEELHSAGKHAGETMDKNVLVSEGLRGTHHLVRQQWSHMSEGMDREEQP